MREVVLRIPRCRQDDRETRFLLSELDYTESHLYLTPGAHNFLVCTQLRVLLEQLKGFAGGGYSQPF